MSDDEASVKDKLDEFRRRWREELVNKSTESTGYKERVQFQFKHGGFTKELSDFKERNGLSDLAVSETNSCCFIKEGSPLSSHEPESSNSRETKRPDTGIIFLNLPDPAANNTGKNSAGPFGDKKQKTALGAQDQCKISFLDQLISDIDEITTIPFFDLQIPREVGVKVFSHLSIKDLCQCSIVSKAWRLLAEDDLLWFNVGVAQGFVTKQQDAVLDRLNWKEYIRESVVKKKQQQQRWKERSCQIASMEFDRGGSISAVSSWSHLVCAGYSSGRVLLWNTKGHNGPTYKVMEPHFNGQERPCTTCTAISNNLCVAGFESGSINVWETSFPSSPVHYCNTDGPIKTVAIATDKEPTVVCASENEVRVEVADPNGQWTCRQQRVYESNKVHHMNIIPNTNTTDFNQVVIATRDTIELLCTSPSSKVTLIDHVIGGKITCVDCTGDCIAAGVGPYGYGVLGNKVRLYCPESGRLISLLSGHYHEITCLNLRDSPSNQLVTGSYDKRVRVYDMRTETLVQTFRGHEDYVTTVQMDAWKVVSGSHDGVTCVWDQRMGSMLWSAHARHPVRYCRFDDVQMMSANVPDDAHAYENSWYADDLILHRKNRGTLRIFDFQTENATVGVPDICLSNYDDTAGYNYNIALITPYDVVD